MIRDVIAASVLGALVVITPLSSAVAGSDNTSIQVLSSTTKDVVAVGEAFALVVELYAVLDATGQVAALTSALENGKVELSRGQIDLIRVEPTHVAHPIVAGGESVVKLTRRFVIRALTKGEIEVPRVTVWVNGTDYKSRPAHVYVYRPTTGLHTGSRSIIPIMAERTDPVTRRKVRRNGSAFFIAQDALVTSYHVVSDARKVHILFPDGRRVATDKIWSVDPIRDVAILHVDSKVVVREGITPLTLAKPTTAHSDADRVVFTNGWPGGLRRSTAGITFKGVRLGYDRGWVTSNAVGPGDSGGPLLNRHGEVIGIVTLGTMSSAGPNVLREEVCIANDPRPAIGLMNVTLGPRSMKAVFDENGFRRRPYVQAFRILAMITQRERFDGSLRAQLDDFESSLSTRRTDPGLYFMRGVLYRMMGTRGIANDSFAEVLELYHDYFPATYMLGLDRLRDGRLQEAKALFERTAMAEPYEDLARYGLARTLMKLHDYEAAALLLEEVTAHDRDFAPGLYDLALCRLAMEDYHSFAIASARLAGTDRSWQRDLERVLSIETLHPPRLRELPRSEIAALPNQQRVEGSLRLYFRSPLRILRDKFIIKSDKSLESVIW